MDWLEEISRRVGKAKYEPPYPGGYPQLLEDFNRMKNYIRTLTESRINDDPYGYLYRGPVKKTPPDSL